MGFDSNFGPLCQMEKCKWNFGNKKYFTSILTHFDSPCTKNRNFFLKIGPQELENGLVCYFCIVNPKKWPPRFQVMRILLTLPLKNDECYYLKWM
jgi:hypothetical protein